MDMLEVDDMNMVEEHDHLTNHQLGQESMNTVEEHYHPTNHRLEVEDIDMVGIHMVEVEGMDMVMEHLSNHWHELEDMDREDSDIGEDMMVEVGVVEREHEGVVLVRHWNDDGAERHQRGRWEWEELTKSGCSKGHITFTNYDSNYSTSHRV
jgi:hypothetical protein